MKNRIPLMIVLTIIYACVITSRSFSLFVNPIERPVIQFGMDSTMVDSLLNHKLETSRFLFRYSAKFRYADQLQSRVSSYESFCDTVSHILQLPKSTLKTPIYLYADSVEQLLCFKGWSALRENQAFTGPNEIHANGLGAIEHEIVHVLANNLIAYAKSVFFAEGIEQYVEIVRSDEVFRKDLRIAKKFISKPWDKWANDTIGFWATGEDESIVVAYPVSGLFVKFLLQHSNLEIFKEFYRAIRTEVSTEAAFYKIYKYPLSKAISDFKKDILSW